MEWDRIVADPAVMNGQPCIRGTRLTIRRVLLLLARYTRFEELREDYPQLTAEDIRQALEFAAASLDDQIIELRSDP